MSRRRWLAGVGTVLFLMTAAVGCKVTDFTLFGLFQETKLGPDDQILVGSLETVSDSYKRKLQHLGINAKLTRADKEVRIAATDRSGQEFVVVFTAHETEDGTDATHVHFEWESTADSEFKTQTKASIGFPKYEKPK